MLQQLISSLQQPDDIHPNKINLLQCLMIRSRPNFIPLQQWLWHQVSAMLLPAWLFERSC